eukprot:CAMPEP_0174853340 /NCGR_PEP_ID=MMETSP1114-20130205/28001_1 /TAXON_ID=312471 /ORGANISM="Neobodo designis, Strain CCAP 1951/1" /LENGTH=215 /DNA_ID=CAMNT_0016087975 /DNA_START=42 /DNA_END=689 /DNA_ORIENTATION=+
MNLSTNVVNALQLKRCDVPLELQANFAALRHVPLFFAGHIRKLNHRFALQDRVLIATLDHVYVCDPNGDILRCFPYSYIETVLVDDARHQIALVVPSEYDVAFTTPETHKLLHVIEVIRGLHHAATPLRVEHVSAASNDAADEDEDDNNGSAPEGGAAPSGAGCFSRLFAWARGPGRKDEWFTGKPGSNCIGRGYFAVRLKQPPGFELCLTNRNE